MAWWGGPLPRPFRVAPAMKPYTPTYSQSTIAKLRWQYGYDRAVDIVQGADPATNRDLARWRTLGHPLTTKPLGR